MQKKTEPRKKALALFVLIFATLTVTMFIQSLLQSRLPVSCETISEVVINPEAWNNRTVKVDGTIQRTSLGVVLPFNYWLSDIENQTIRIGVKWHSEADLSGKNVRVIGVVTKGYAWVHPDHPGWWVYFINASSVSDI